MSAPPSPDQLNLLLLSPECQAMLKTMVQEMISSQQQDASFEENTSCKSDNSSGTDLVLLRQLTTEIVTELTICVRKSLQELTDLLTANNLSIVEQFQKKLAIDFEARFLRLETELKELIEKTVRQKPAPITYVPQPAPLKDLSLTRNMELMTELLDMTMRRDDTSVTKMSFQQDSTLKEQCGTLVHQLFNKRANDFISEMQRVTKKVEEIRSYVDEKVQNNIGALWKIVSDQRIQLLQLIEGDTAKAIQFGSQPEIQE